MHPSTGLKLNGLAAGLLRETVVQCLDMFGDGFNYNRGEIILVGSLFRRIDNLFVIPRSCYVKSYINDLFGGTLDIFQVFGEISDRFQYFPISAMKCKAVCIPNLNSKTINSYAIFPLSMESND